MTLGQINRWPRDEQLRRTMCVLLAASLALLTYACASPPAVPVEQEPAHLKVTSQPYISFAPYYIAQAEGYFAEEGLEVEFVDLTGEDATPLLVQGELDVIAGFGVYYLNAMARGAELKVVADKGHIGTTGCSSGAVVVRRELFEMGELDSATELEGRTLPLRSASMEEYYLEKLLDTAGLTLDDLETTYMPQPAELEAMAQGSIDLSMASEPWATRHVQTGNAVLWMPYNDFVPGEQHVTVVYGPSLLKTNPDAGRRFMVAYLRGVRQYNEGKTDRNLEIMAEFSGLDKEFLQAACWFDVYDDGHVNVQSLLDFQEWAVGKGYLDSVVPQEELYDPSFIEYANQVLGTASQ
ncbi:MAG: ABC transporter substrate-binding protein [Anaerolineae bacterium]|nr:ABC transporter substrate-binding protein [Anaerolineae bacterium]